ncbi:MAG: D-tyrosyl-tRNA(Tyr) deacylase [Acidobacteria bacterium]|nr:D-tyrosyl-tRNA(Tyr) deacylase [Acidobacteriota bacterium]
MKALLQKVSEAWVKVDGRLVSKIGKGLLIFLAVLVDDGEKEADYLAKRVAELRIFPDDEGKMNRSLLDVGGEALVVSQFTLAADTRKGRRPNFINAAKPEEAERLYNHFIEKLREQGVPVASGVFQAMMEVGLINDGPVTFLIESKKR